MGDGRGLQSRKGAAERRREERLRRRRRVQLDPGAVQAVTEDISLGGTFVLTARLLRPGTRVALTFQTPERLVRTHGLVRWVRTSQHYARPLAPVGMGIEFVAAEDETG